MYLNKYKIEGSLNLDSHSCFSTESTYPSFQEDLEFFKQSITDMVRNKENKTFFKFGDGDYFFLKSTPVGSASPGRRAISKQYSEIDMEPYINGSKLNDFYTCEIYPENRKMFNELFPSINISFPSEFGYGLVANKWFFKQFSGKIGLIGGEEKIKLIEKLMRYEEYQDYLGITKFNDYITIPQKFACDDLDYTESVISEQLKNSSSDIFLVGIGHVKSGLTHRLKKYKNAIYFDVGSGIDAIAGIIDINRPYFGDWINYQICEDDIYKKIDYLQYNGLGQHKFLNKK